MHEYRPEPSQFCLLRYIFQICLRSIHLEWGADTVDSKLAEIIALSKALGLTAVLKVLSVFCNFASWQNCHTPAMQKSRHPRSVCLQKCLQEKKPLPLSCYWRQCARATLASAHHACCCRIYTHSKSIARPFWHFLSPSWGSTQDLRLQRTATNFIRHTPVCSPPLPPDLPVPQERRRTDRCMPGTNCCCLLVFRTLSTALEWWWIMPKWPRKKLDTMLKPFIGDSEIICHWTPCCRSTGQLPLLNWIWGLQAQLMILCAPCKS